MGLVTSGTNWEVREGFISGFDAGYASGQALNLISSDSGSIERVDPINGAWVAEAMDVFRVDVERLESESGPDASKLLEVYARTEALAKNGLGEFFLNIYKPFASTSRHRDSYEVGDKSASATVAVGLLGLGELEIEDPETGEIAVVSLKPGDSLHLNHAINEEERPLHIVRNKLIMPRIAIVNG